MKLIKFQKIEVIWEDSVHDSGWTKDSDYENGEQDQDLPHSTCGYFLRYTPRSIMIVQSRKISSDKKGMTTVDSMMQIPKKAVIKIKKLR